jgi:hypothetical protein
VGFFCRINIHFKPEGNSTSAKAKETAPAKNGKEARKSKTDKQRQVHAGRSAANSKPNTKPNLKPKSGSCRCGKRPVGNGRQKCGTSCQCTIKKMG